MTASFHIVSPVDGSVYAERALVTREAALAAVEDAAEAQAAWRRTPLSERRGILGEAVDRLLIRGEVVAQELSRQMGRPVGQGRGELAGFEERARHMLDIAPRALRDLEPEPKYGFRRFIRREPLGVVFAIAPWNYPYLTAVNSIWPALAAGNAVLLKHAAQTALCGERIEEALREAGLPENVFRSLHMDHETAAAVLQHAAVGMVCFTGSVAGGRQVQRALGENEHFPGLGLELGGKDPAYVRADADVASAAEGIADGAFSNAGQSCCSIERVYVHESLYEDLVDALVHEAHALKLGNPLERDTTLGPMVTAAAADFVRGQVRDALTAGAEARIDSRTFAADEGAGPYLAPQVLVHVDHSMRVMREESFGPVVGVMPVGSDDEAVALINDSAFGLSASVWTRDADAAERLGDRLQTGTVFMNRADYLDPALAWTGVKRSGRGCTLSALGYEHLTRPKSFHLKL